MENMITVDRYVLDTLMRDLTGHDRRAASYLVYLSVLNAGGGKAVALSHQQLAACAGLSKRTVQDAVAHLARRGLLAIERGGHTEPALLKPLSPWRR
jgi:DNA-binding IscR family transcriptional regulator